MSYIKNIETVYGEMRRCNIRFWQIFDGQTKTDLIAESNDDEGLTIEESIQHLMEVTASLEGVVYIIIRRDEAPRKRKVVTEVSTALQDKNRGIYKFQVMLGETTLQKASGNNTFGASTSMFNQILAMQEANFNLRLEMMQKEFNHARELENKLREINEKLEKKSGKENNVISDEYAKKGLALLEKLLEKKLG